MRFPLSVTLLATALACTTVQPPQAPSSVQARPVEAPVEEQVHTSGGGGRPVELAEQGYKEAREEQALAGLVYGTGEEGRVTVDAAAAAAILATVDDAAPAPELAREAYAQGLELYARNARLESIAAHTRAVLLDPQAVGMYEGLGDALRAERFESRAEAAYRTGLDLEPTAGLHVRLAELLWMRGASASAIEHGLAAVALAPDDARASADLARWFYFTGDDARAWDFVHRCDDLGAALPAQFRPLLASRTPEPRR